MSNTSKLYDVSTETEVFDYIVDTLGTFTTNVVDQSHTYYL